MFIAFHFPPCFFYLLTIYGSISSKILFISSSKPVICILIGCDISKAMIHTKSISALLFCNFLLKSTIFFIVFMSIYFSTISLPFPPAFAHTIYQILKAIPLLFFQAYLCNILGIIIYSIGIIQHHYGLHKMPKYANLF